VKSQPQKIDKDITMKKSKIPAGKKTECEKKTAAKKIFALAAVSIFLVVCLGAFVMFHPGAAKKYTGKNPVGLVNNEPFFQEDLDVYAAELRAAVAADYGRKYNLSGMGAGFWDTTYGSGSPRETLYQLAQRKLIRNMVLIQEARRRGIDTPASYHDLEAERAEWNKPSDEIMYGPQNYGPAEYNSYRITGITNELKTVLLKKELAPAKSQLRTAFASLPDDLKHAPYSASGIHFTWNSDGPSPAGKIRAALQAGFPPEEVVRSLAGSFPGLSWEDFELDSKTVSKEDSYQQNLARSLETASRGAFVSGPEKQAELYYVTRKEGGGLLTFEEAPGLGQNKWINDQFEIFLDKKVKAAKVKIYK
jgi:hypothetical protein